MKIIICSISSRGREVIEENEVARVVRVVDGEWGEVGEVVEGGTERAEDMVVV